MIPSNKYPISLIRSFIVVFMYVYLVDKYRCRFTVFYFSCGLRTTGGIVEIKAIRVGYIWTVMYFWYK